MIIASNESPKKADGKAEKTISDQLPLSLSFLMSLAHNKRINPQMMDIAQMAD